MKMKLSTFFIILFLTSCSKIITLSQNTAKKISSCQKTINEMLLLTNQDILPKEFCYDNDKLMKIDINNYFNVLDHLSLESGYTLDYVHFSDNWGSKPLIYARRLTHSSYKSYSDYITSVNNGRNNEYSFQELRNAYDYLEHIHVDGKVDGFFQLVVLRIMGDQFYLDWHALYNDTIIVCNNERLNKLEQQLNLPIDIVQLAKGLDFTPSVELKEDKAIVKVVLFTKWGGFKEMAYVISQNFPHKILNTYIFRQIKYDWGVRF
jgi:hypothetical protein